MLDYGHITSAAAASERAAASPGFGCVQALRHFGALDKDLMDKQKYADWKASDIRIALKQGRQPTPGSPADQTIGKSSNEECQSAGCGTLLTPV